LGPPCWAMTALFALLSAAVAKRRLQTSMRKERVNAEEYEVSQGQAEFDTKEAEEMVGNPNFSDRLQAFTEQISAGQLEAMMADTKPQKQAALGQEQMEAVKAKQTSLLEFGEKSGTQLIPWQVRGLAARAAPRYGASPRALMMPSSAIAREERSAKQRIAWERMLKFYDEKVADILKDFQHVKVPTSFGYTQVYTYGDRTLPTVFVFHGMRGSSLQMAFLIPAIKGTRRIIMVDYICDIGRSEPTRAPQNATDTMVWVKEIFGSVGVPPDAKVTLVGYSYGAFVSATIALHAPDLVDRLVVIAPAGTFGNLTSGFLLRAGVVGLLSDFGFEPDWIRGWLAAPGFDVKSAKATWQWQLMEQMTNVVPENKLQSLPGILPTSFSDEELRNIARSCPTTLLMPEFEMVIEPQQAMARARAAGMEVIVIPNTGHAASLENPQWLADRIRAIL